MEKAIQFDKYVKLVEEYYDQERRKRMGKDYVPLCSGSFCHSWLGNILEERYCYYPNRQKLFKNLDIY